jgi:hypothetical protein
MRHYEWCANVGAALMVPPHLRKGPFVRSKLRIRQNWQTELHY